MITRMADSAENPSGCHTRKDTAFCGGIVFSAGGFARATPMRCAMKYAIGVFRLFLAFELVVY